VKHAGFFRIVLLSAAFICGFTACDNSTVSTDDSIEMVWIPAGTFTIGSFIAEIAGGCVAPQPEHDVIITKGFYMGKYEITQAQYRAVMGTNPSYFQGSNLPGGVKTDKLPVERVSWYDTVEFCNALSLLEGFTPAYDIDKDTPDPNNTNGLDPFKWKVTLIPEAMGYRLPTEAQWEYACRARTTTAYYTGDTVSDKTGWYSANSGGTTHEVGKKAPNNFGLYDMHGNVWEWCWDYIDYEGVNYYTSAPNPDTDPAGLGYGNRRAERGGGYKHTPGRMYSAYRERYQPQSRDNDLGFRVIRP
jgi:formylglycine-generating enzyme required for sulfatase activity